MQKLDGVIHRLVSLASNAEAAAPVRQQHIMSGDQTVRFSRPNRAVVRDSRDGLLVGGRDCERGICVRVARLPRSRGLGHCKCP